MFASSEQKRKSRYAGGPHGLGIYIFHNFSLILLYIVYKICVIKFLGDPDDYKLRKIEQNVVIPKIVRERAKYEKCSEENKSILYLV